MEKLRPYLKWVFTTSLLVLVYPVASEFFIEWAREKGWYSTPSTKVHEMMGFVETLATSNLWPWWIFSAGCATSLWIDWLLRSFTKPSSSDNLPSDLSTLYIAMEDIRKKLVNLKADWDEQRKSLDSSVPISLRAEVKSVFIRANKLGIVAPDLQNADGDAYLMPLARYIVEMIPLVRDRHHAEAKATAKELVRSFTAK